MSDYPQYVAPQDYTAVSQEEWEASNKRTRRTEYSTNGFTVAEQPPRDKIPNRQNSIKLDDTPISRAAPASSQTTQPISNGTVARHEPQIVNPTYRPSPDAHTALVSAVLKDDFNRVRELMAKGFDINSANILGETVLQQAAMYNKGVSELLELGANPHAISEQGRNALTTAVENGSAESAAALIKEGVDAKHADMFGKSAEYYAKESSSPKIKELFNLAGTEQAASAAVAPTAPSVGSAAAGSSGTPTEAVTPSAPAPATRSVSSVTNSAPHAAAPTAAANAAQPAAPAAPPAPVAAPTDATLAERIGKAEGTFIERVTTGISDHNAGLGSSGSSTPAASAASPALPAAEVGNAPAANATSSSVSKPEWSLFIYKDGSAQGRLEPVIKNIEEHDPGLLEQARKEHGGAIPITEEPSRKTGFYDVNDCPHFNVGKAETAIIPGGKEIPITTEETMRNAIYDSVKDRTGVNDDFARDLRNEHKLPQLGNIDGIKFDHQGEKSHSVASLSPLGHNENAPSMIGGNSDLPSTFHDTSRIIETPTPSLKFGEDSKPTFDSLGGGERKVDTGQVNLDPKTQANVAELGKSMQGGGVSPVVDINTGKLAQVGGNSAQVNVNAPTTPTDPALKSTELAPV